jgi:serine/threonine-protein kinase PRP4
LRDVLQKFGKGVGVSLQAVRSYFGQMIAAAAHLQRHGIVHADLKPDNILVSADFATIQLADFGSAYDVKVSGEDTLPTTPYLVSRFYRAPEIILGLKPTYAIDLWSLAVTVAELFLGDVLFRGGSNNDMLYVFMQTLGPIPNRVIRQHVVQAKKFGLPVHFQQQPGGAYYFSQDSVDAVSGTKVHKLLSLLTDNTANNQQQQQQQRKFPSATPLAKLLRKAQSQNDPRAMVDNFTDLLKQCLHLDPARRIALHDALRHGFFATPATTTTGATM